MKVYRTPLEETRAPEKELFYFSGILFFFQFLVTPTISMAQGTVINFILAGFVLLAWFCLKTAQLLVPPKIFRFSALDLWVSAFWGLLFCSFFFYVPRLESLRMGIPWLCFLLGYFVVKTLASEHSCRSLLLRLGIVTAVWASLDGIYQYYIGLNLSREWLLKSQEGLQYFKKFSETEQQLFLGRLHTQRAYGNFLLPNFLAAYVGMWIPVLCGILWENRQKKAVRLGGIGLILLFVALFLTKSRGGVLSLGLVFGFWLAYFSPCSRRLLKWLYWLAFLCGCLFFLGVYFQYLSLPPSLIFVQNGVKSFGVRLEYWEVGFRMFQEFPFGVGLNNFATHYFRLKIPSAEETKFAHNNFLQITNELSLLGLFLLVGIFWTVFRFRRESQETDQKTVSTLSPSWLLVGSIGIGLAYLFSDFLKGSLFLDTSLAPGAYWLQFFFQGSSLLFLVGVFRYARSFSMEGKAIDIGLKLGVFVFLVHSLVDFNLYIFPLFQLVFCFLALLNVSDWHWERVYSNRIRFALGGSAVLFVFLFLGIGLWPEIQREVWSSKGEQIYAQLGQLLQILEEPKKTPIPLDLRRIEQSIEEGISAYERALHFWPVEWKWLIRQGLLLETYARLLLSLQHHPHFSKEVRQNLVQRYFATMERAIELFEKAGRHHPYSAESFLLVAQMHWHYAQKRFEENTEAKQKYLRERSLPALEKAVSLYPVRPRSLFELGKLYEELQDYEKAQETLETAQRYSQVAGNIEERFNQEEQQGIINLLQKIKSFLKK